jgi:hypothetical protein
MRILSGGQTGVDRAALDTAMEKGLAYGGWCPRGGWAEDLSAPPGLLALYPVLQETPLTDPAQRTEWNVRDADRLMILVDSAGIGVSKGTEAAREHARRIGKPWIVLDVDSGGALKLARAFLGEDEGSSVCIAGPRESEAPCIHARARAFLCELL